MVNAKVSEKLRKLNGKGSWCFTGLLAVAALAPLARGQYGQEPQPDVPAFHSDAEEVNATTGPALVDVKKKPPKPEKQTIWHQSAVPILSPIVVRERIAGNCDRSDTASR